MGHDIFCCADTEKMKKAATYRFARAKTFDCSLNLHIFDNTFATV
jgi:hypothetical protein